MNKKDQFEDFYEFLNLTQDANANEIKSQIRKYEQAFHPDHHLNRRQWAEEQTKRVNRAKEILLDPSKRKAYDEEYAEKRGAEHSQEAPPRLVAHPNVVDLGKTGKDSCRRFTIHLRNEGAHYTGDLTIQLKPEDSWLAYVSGEWDNVSDSGSFEFAIDTSCASSVGLYEGEVIFSLGTASVVVPIYIDVASELGEEVPARQRSQSTTSPIYSGKSSMSPAARGLILFLMIIAFALALLKLHALLGPDTRDRAGSTSQATDQSFNPLVNLFRPVIEEPCEYDSTVSSPIRFTGVKPYVFHVNGKSFSYDTLGGDGGWRPTRSGKLLDDPPVVSISGFKVEVHPQKGDRKYQAQLRPLGASTPSYDPGWLVLVLRDESDTMVAKCSIDADGYLHELKSKQHTWEQDSWGAEAKNSVLYSRWHKVNQHLHKEECIRITFHFQGFKTNTHIASSGIPFFNYEYAFPEGILQMEYGYGSADEPGVPGGADS